MNEPQVLFDSDRIEAEWNDPRLPAVLREVVLDAAAYAEKAHDWQFQIDSIFRTDAENTAAGAKTRIHVFWRAVDVRGRTQRQATLDDVALYTNKRWQYDRAEAHPVCYAAPHGSGPHLHAQVSAETVRRSS